jgi:two-component system cell cycle sensor histidine kinase/response regulator CckA
VGPLILCVDDDPLVREVTQTALERNGYRVLQAATGAEAISVLEKAPQKISLVILDWRVPDMQCAEVIARLKTLRSGLKVLLTSGYDRATVLHRVTRHAVDGFLPKPYLPRQLVQRVEWALRPMRLPRAMAGRAL